MADDLGKRIEKAADLVGGVPELARLSGVPERSIRNYVDGHEPKAKVAHALAKAAAVRFDWLVTGAPPMREATRLKQESARYKLDAGPNVKGRVPLISFVQAGNFSQAVDNLHPGEAEEWVETTVPIHRHTYALRIEGDSMTNPTGQEPTFPNGCIVVVEPEVIGDPPAMLGRFVIVKRAGTDEATFKQLVRDAGRWLLKPLNPQFQVIELREDDVFCGVVREKVVRFF